MPTPKGKLMPTVNDQMSSELPRERKQSRALKGVDPMVNAPAARLDEPIAGGVEAVDQQQEHRPYKKISKGNEHHRHQEVAAGETRRRAAREA